jgi:glycosyltransferase involved in cell wall biosynthesis
VPRKSSKPDALRIGLVPLISEWGGGVYQYSQTMLGVVAELREGRDDEFVLLADGLSNGDSVLNGTTWEIASVTPPGASTRVVQRLKHVARNRLPAQVQEHLNGAWQRLDRWGETPTGLTPRRRPEVRAWFDRLQIDLVLYPASMPLSFEVGTPYVFAVHDLQHRLQPEFPEVSAGDEFANREYVFHNGVRDATIVLTDSEVGKEDVLNLYGDLIAPERVAVLPFLPAVPETVTVDDRERVRREYRLPERFLLYPAQMWPHKNHRRLVEAVAELKNSDGIDVELVFTGSRTGEIRQKTFDALMARVRELGLERQVHYLGYVAGADMAALYGEALGLVMPTFFGPTNIPILEAWSLDCPVITSDIRGVREQAGDAALLADPRSVGAIAEAVRRLWFDEDLRKDLVARGRGGHARRALYGREDYATRLSAILDQAAELVRDSAPHV